MSVTGFFLITWIQPLMETIDEDRGRDTHGSQDVGRRVVRISGPT